MTVAHIDSATITGAIAALDYGTPRIWHPWAYESIKTLTSLMLFHHQLFVLPSLKIDEKWAEGDDLYDFTWKRLEPVLPIQGRTYAEHSMLTTLSSSALAVLKNWLRQNNESARAAVDLVKSKDSYEPWLDWAIENAWEGHSRRLDGLFNVEMVEELAIVLNCDVRLLYQVWQKSRDLEQIKFWKKTRQGEDFILAREAFIAAAVFRGRYHEFLGRYVKWQVVHHPIRQNALDQPAAARGTRLVLAKPIDYFSNILLNTAMKERSSKARIELWLKNVQMARMRPRVTVDLCEPEDNEDNARRTAIRAARRIGIQVYPDWLKFCDAILDLGIGVLTSFVLTNWSAFVVTAGATLATRPVTRIARAVTLREGNLRNLTALPPGRITQILGSNNSSLGL
jgi:hypothetical protein